MRQIFSTPIPIPFGAVLPLAAWFVWHGLELFGQLPGNYSPSNGKAGMWFYILLGVASGIWALGQLFEDFVENWREERELRIKAERKIYLPEEAREMVAQATPLTTQQPAPMSDPSLSPSEATKINQETPYLSQQSGT